MLETSGVSQASIIPTVHIDKAAFSERRSGSLSERCTKNNKTLTLSVDDARENHRIKIFVVIIPDEMDPC